MDEETDRAAEIRTQIGKLIQEAASLREGQDIFILGWAIAYEGTSVELENEQMSLRGVLTAEHQMVSASLGLGHYMRTSFEPGVSFDFLDGDDEDD